MNRFLVFGLALMVLLPLARGQGADDQYVHIYTLIQQGDALATGQPDQALTKYLEAQTALQKFQKIYPNWNHRIVNFRMNYLTSQIALVSARVTPAARPAPVPAPNATPAPPASAPVTPTVAAATVPPAPSTPAVSAPAIIQPAPLPQTVSAAADLENQMNLLRAQLRQLQSEKSTLEAKLKEALAARPAASDPVELAKAEALIQTLQKENESLKAGLARQQTAPASAAEAGALEAVRQELAAVRRQLSEQIARADQLASENQSLQARVKTLNTEAEAAIALRAENEMLKKLAAKPAEPANTDTRDPGRQLAEARAQIAALQSDQEVLRLEKIALQNRVRQLTENPVITSIAPAAGWPEDSARVKQLERERDDLQKKLETAQRELYGRRRTRETVARVDQLTGELNVLRARLEVYEARQVPYSAEELALFKPPEITLPVTDPRAGRRPASELPAGTVTLVAQAQRDFAEKRFSQAEEKYLEVLRRDDKNINTLANLATIQMEMGRLDEAEKHLNQALRMNADDAYSLSILGNLKYRQAKYDDALDALSRAAKLEPQNAEIQNYLGLALSQKGLRAPAETALRKAIQLRPNYGGAHNNLAVIYATQKPPLLSLARWHYERARAAGFPENPELEKLLEQNQTAEGR